MAIELNTPQDLYSVVGIQSYTLDKDYVLGSNIDFKDAKLGDGSPAWFNEQRPYGEYGSGTGILKWTPRLFNGMFLFVIVGQWRPDYMSYMEGEVVMYQGSFYRCMVWDTWESPENPAHWRLIEEWNEDVIYNSLDIVLYDGRLWECWSSDPAYPPGDEFGYDWSEMQIFYTSYTPLNYRPYNLDEVNMIEQYLGLGTANPIGSWGGMLPFGAYNYGYNGSTYSVFKGKFDFNGKCIKNLYMDYRGLDSDSVANTCPANNCFKSFVSRFGARNVTDFDDKFAGSSPHFINPCIIAQKSTSVLYNHDTDSLAQRPVMTGGVTIENPFVLTETMQASAMSNHFRYQITGDIRLKNITVVSLQKYEEAAGVIAALAGNSSVGDAAHPAVIGDIKIDGRIICKRICSRTGILFGGMDIDNNSAGELAFPNIEINVDVIADDVAARADKNNSAALPDFNPDEIGFLIGCCRSTGGTVIFGNLSLSGKMIVNKQRQYLTDIAALIGKIETAYNIVFGKTVLAVEVSTQGADKYLFCIDNQMGIITLGDMYFDSTLAGNILDELGLPLTTGQMRQSVSFANLDLKDTWQMGKRTPLIRKLAEKIKTNGEIKNLYTGI